MQYVLLPQTTASQAVRVTAPPFVVAAPQGSCLSAVCIKVLEAFWWMSFAMAVEPMPSTLQELVRGVQRSSPELSIPLAEARL